MAVNDYIDIDATQAELEHSIDVAKEIDIVPEHNADGKKSIEITDEDIIINGGQQLSEYGSQCVAIGGGTIARNQNTTAVGFNASATNNGAVAVGSFSLAPKINSVAIGTSANATPTVAPINASSTWMGSVAQIGANNQRYAFAVGDTVMLGTDRKIPFNLLHLEALNTFITALTSATSLTDINVAAVVYLNSIGETNG